MEDLVLESERRNRELECRLEQLITDCEQFEELLRVAEREKKAILKKYQMIQLQVRTHIHIHVARTLCGSMEI